MYQVPDHYFFHENVAAAGERIPAQHNGPRKGWDTRQGPGVRLPTQA